MSSDPAIRLHGLGKAYPLYESEAAAFRSFLSGRRTNRNTLWALKDVSLTVRRGEALGIVGRNGAGKSTLLKILTGVVTPTEGTFSISGRVAAMLELGAGFHPDFTGRENARFAATIMGISEEDFRRILPDIERFADIGAFFDRRISEYSSGMYARLAFAVSIHCEPDILIADEILSVGDIAFQHKCIQFLRGYCDQGGTLLFVSHDESAVRVVCDTAAWLHDGRIAEIGKPDQVLRRYHASVWQSQSGSGNFQVSSGATDNPVDSHSDEPEMAAPSSPDALEPARTLTGCIDTLTCEGADGAMASLAGDGASLRISASVRAGTALEAADVVVLLRNRLAQVVFGECSRPPLDMEPGDHSKASFLVDLPDLTTGDYTIEAYLVAQEDGVRRRVARHESLRLPVHSRQGSHSIVNIPMLGASVEVEA